MKRIRVTKKPALEPTAGRDESSSNRIAKRSRHVVRAVALLGRDGPLRYRDQRSFRLAFPRKNLQHCRIAGRKHQRNATGLRRAR